MNPIGYQAKWLAIIAVIVTAIILMVVHSHAASFYPACLKRDGDWLHGVTPRECRQLGGHWYTASVLKKARRVW